MPASEVSPSGASAGPALADRAQALASRHAALKAEHDLAAARAAELTETVGRAKWRVGQKPQVDRILEALQARQHERALGRFERLLCGLVHDVLPEPVDIRLSLGTSRGLPALHVNAERQGCKEDIYENCGGSLNNIISAGLRYAAVVRSGLRPFIALDEADCWLPDAQVPAFIGTISEVAREVGVQTLMISHHPPQVFRRHVPHIVHVEGTPSTGLSAHAETVPEWAPDQPGIRSLRLRNWRSHVDTRIPLSPHVTALVGGPNIGKSNIIKALRALAYGCEDGDVRHGAEAAVVEAVIEDDQSLRMTRTPGAKHKMRFELLDADGIPADSSVGAAVPAFVRDRLRIEPVEDLDIQISNQKRTVFVLDQPATRRAAILSVGREGSRSHLLLRRHKDRLATDRAAIEQGESEMARLQPRLQALEPITGLADACAALPGRAAFLDGAHRDAAALADHVEAMTAMADGIAADEKTAATLEGLQAPPALADTSGLAALIAELDPLEVEVAALTRRAEVLTHLPDTPAVRETAGLADAIGSLEAAAAEQDGVEKAHAALCDIPAPPQMADTRALHGHLVEFVGVVKAMRADRTRLDILQSAPAEPVLQDPETVERGIADLEAGARAVAGEEEALRAVEANLKDARRAIDETVAAMGGRCPTCGTTGIAADHILQEAS